jgi:uncharacterized cupredoxin-like copper-binding protein
MLAAMHRALAAALASLIVGIACAPPVPEADISKGQIRADLKEYVVALTSATVRPGQVTFISRNIGSIAHDFIVIKTDLAADKLPVDGPTQKAKTDGRVDGVEEIPPGQTRNLRIDLPAGHYVVICNVPTHYQLGMRTELNVQ